MIILQFVLAKRTYSQKHNWDYWTEKEENKGKYICGSCLLDLYYKDKGEYLNQVQNEKKRRVFRQYVHNKIISYS